MYGNRISNSGCSEDSNWNHLTDNITQVHLRDKKGILELLKGHSIFCIAKYDSRVNKGTKMILLVWEL